MTAADPTIEDISARLAKAEAWTAQLRTLVEDLSRGSTHELVRYWIDKTCQAEARIRELEGGVGGAVFAQSEDGDACIEHRRQVEENPKAGAYLLMLINRRSALLAAACKLAKHWRDQDGFNASVIDEMADAARLYEVIGRPEFTQPCVACSECTGQHHWQEYVGYACKHCELSAPTELVEQLMGEQVRTCRVCGCTEEDCSQCIAKMGQPCSWVEADLCSACQPLAKSFAALDALHAAMEANGFRPEDGPPRHGFTPEGERDRLAAYEATKRAGEGD